MHPRVVLIAGLPSPNRASVWNALDSSECWIIQASQYKLSLLEDQLKLAHAVVLVVDRWLTATTDDAQLRLVMETVQKHLDVRPEFPAIALVDRNLDFGIPLGLSTIFFDQAPSTEDLQRVVQSIKNAVHLSTSDLVPAPTELVEKASLAELVEEAGLQRERLKLIASRSEYWPIIKIVPAALITVLGVALSIPAFLSRLGQSNAWLSIGPVIFIAGGLATIYLIRRERRERERRRLARFLAYRLEAVINEIAPSRETTKPLFEPKNISA